MEETNVNLAQCMVTKTHFGYDTVINICSGKTMDVSWSFGDWAAAAFVSFCILLMLGVVGLMISMIRSEF